MVRSWKFIQGDCLEVMRRLPKDSVDLVFGSPPYEAARTYGIGFDKRGQDWVDWMVEVYKASLRVCTGLVAFVVEGQTRKYRYSATPALLMADLHRAGICLRKPPVFHRVGIPGSGGPDWLRNDWEWIICASRLGQLPFSDNTACGHVPVWAPGGAMSHRVSDGSRVNRTKWGKTGHGGGRLKDGTKDFRVRPSHGKLVGPNGKTCSASKGNRVDKRIADQGRETENDIQRYNPPAKANPGNIITCEVGGGAMGSKLAHESEAPFPEKLVMFFIKSFCEPGGTVLDPFSGSGTTVAVAVKQGCKGIGIDIRESQIALGKKRLLRVERTMGFDEFRRGHAK